MCATSQKVRDAIRTSQYQLAEALIECDLVPPSRGDLAHEDLFGIIDAQRGRSFLFCRIDPNGHASSSLGTITSVGMRPGQGLCVTVTNAFFSVLYPEKTARGEWTGRWFARGPIDNCTGYLVFR